MYKKGVFAMLIKSTSNKPSFLEEKKPRKTRARMYFMRHSQQINFEKL